VKRKPPNADGLPVKIYVFAWLKWLKSQARIVFAIALPTKAIAPIVATTQHLIILISRPEE
jgi:hypothetical protein